jgi:hypothetical protein
MKQTNQNQLTHLMKFIYLFYSQILKLQFTNDKTLIIIESKLIEKYFAIFEIFCFTVFYY